MWNFRSLVLLLSFGLPPMVGCGPKKAPETAVDGVVNPKAAFAAGVQILKSPSKDGVIDYAGALAQFEAATTAKPDFSKAHFNAAWTAERMGNVEKAANHYRAALDADPSYNEAFLALGAALTKAGKGDDAVQLYRGASEKAPDDITLRNLLMEALNGADMYDDALLQAREILLRDSKNVGAYRTLSRVYFAKGDYRMSQLCAEKARTLAEGDPGIYNNIGVTYLVMDNEPAAIEEFKTAIKLRSDTTEANLNLGFVALNSGDYSLARQCFEAALKGEPGNTNGKLGLAVALRGAKEYEASAKLYSEILEADPSNQDAYFNAATLYEKFTKDYKKALKVLQDFVDKNNKGQMGPDHEVYARMDRVKESQRIDEERKAEEERKKKEAEERKKRQQQAFEDLKGKVAKLKQVMATYSSCPMMVESGGIDQGQMVLEQAEAVIQSEEIDMAGDITTFVDDLMPQLEAIIPSCGGGAAPAPAPAPEAPAPAPAPDAPAAPAGGEAPAPQ